MTRAARYRSVTTSTNTTPITRISEHDVEPLAGMGMVEPEVEFESKSLGATLFAFAADLEHRQEGFLRDFNATDPLHPLLAFLLLFE